MNLHQRFSLKPRLKVSWIKYLGDLTLITLAYYGAFYLRFDGYILPSFWEIFTHTLPLVLVVKIVLLHQYNLHRCFWQYTGLKELIALLKVLTLASICVTASYALASGALIGIPRSILFLDWFLSLLFLGSFRMLPRILREHPISKPSFGNRNNDDKAIHRESLILYGAGDLGISLARQIEEGFSKTKAIIGFIDDDPSKSKLRINDILVLGDRSVLAEVARKKRIDEIIITISAISGQKLNEIVAFCRKFSPSVQVAPGLDELFRGKVHISDLREFQIEDLLGREKAQLDEESLGQFLSDRRILVTGAGGSIGSELCFQILKFNPEKLILFGRGENSIYQVTKHLQTHARENQLEPIIGDVLNDGKLDRVLRDHQPQIIFHAAADKHVPLMELNPDEAVLTNIVGTQNVLNSARNREVEKVVCISTDKAVNPASVMGCCKRITELLVQNQDWGKTIVSTVRFGNVIGSRGSVVPLFKDQIARGGPITLTHPEVKRYFMTIPEAVLLVLQAGAVCEGGEIFLLEMGEATPIVDLARRMIQLSGLDEEKIAIEFIGLRPGEKLEEELTFSFEKIGKTTVPKLYRLQGKTVAHLHLNQQIRTLKELAIKMDFAGIQEALKKVVPQYRPQQEHLQDVFEATGIR